MSIKTKDNYLIFDKATEILLVLPLLIILSGSIYLCISSINPLFQILNLPLALFGVYSLLRIGRRTYSKLYIVSVLILSVAVLVLGLTYLGNGIIGDTNLKCDDSVRGIENCAPVGGPFVVGRIGAVLAPPFSILALVAVLSLRKIPKSSKIVH